jgi:hypothetical protein
VGQSHGALEFRNLEHPQRWFAVDPLDKPEAVEGRERSKGAVEPLPSSSAVRPVVDDQEVLLGPKLGNALASGVGP